jgi:hypothetical protein
MISRNFLVVFYVLSILYSAQSFKIHLHTEVFNKKICNIRQKDFRIIAIITSALISMTPVNAIETSSKLMGGAASTLMQV